MKAPAGVVIPSRIITKPPSAELRANQRDDDSLPPYEVLDAILEGLVERDCSVADLVAQGFDLVTVKRASICSTSRNTNAFSPRQACG